MPLYEYKCPDCGYRQSAFERGDRAMALCPMHGYREFKRVFGFAMQPMMHEHYNRTVQKPISDMKQFKAELGRLSDEATERTGIPHNYQPIDLNDHEAVGVSNEGIEESNRQREKEGAPLLPEIK